MQDFRKNIESFLKNGGTYIQRDRQIEKLKQTVYFDWQAQLKLEYSILEWPIERMLGHYLKTRILPEC